MYILLIIFIIFNILDGLISLYALKSGLHEKNPLLYFVFHHTGLLGFIIAKTILVSLVAVFLSEFSLESLVILNIVYALIVTNNTLKLYIWRSNGKRI